MRPYADTNFFTRLYLRLTDTKQAIGALQEALARRVLPVTALHRMELANAFELSVWLAKQGGHPMVTSEQAAIALATFREDLKAQSFLTAANPDPERIESEFLETAARHTARHGFRAYDILHVVSARLLGCDTFFSFDLKARKLAVLEGLAVGP